MYKDRIGKYAFTLAEVLITLAIIGVVAALTIPSVISSYKDKQYNTARLKALKTFGEAGKMASINEEMNGQPDAKTFVNNILSKYLKIVKVCDTAAECSFPNQIQPLDPETEKVNTDDLKKWNQIGYNTWTEADSPLDDDSMSIYMTTADGFSAKIFYNPKCGRNSHEIVRGTCRHKDCNSYAVDEACMNVIYDMNGLKGPNHAGEDIGFVTTFWSGLKAASFAPGIISYEKAKSIYDQGRKDWAEAQDFCAQNSTSKLILTLPSLYELKSIALNSTFDSFPDSESWTGSIVTDREGFAWSVSHGGSQGYSYDKKISTSGAVWCVRR